MNGMMFSRKQSAKNFLDKRSDLFFIKIRHKTPVWISTESRLCHNVFASSYVHAMMLVGVLVLMKLAMAYKHFNIYQMQ